MPADTASDAVVTQGKLLYHSYCSSCHGDSATSTGVLPDLRHSPILKVTTLWYQTVLDGVRVNNGMVGFKSALSTADADDIRAYVIHQANLEKNAAAAAAPNR